MRNATQTFREMRRGARSTLPLLIGIVPLSFILGTQGGQRGLSALGMAILTGMNFGGGSEFAAIALWDAVPPFLVIVLSTWLINCRHIVLGAALTPYVEKAKTPLPMALAAFFLMSDETWALSMSDIEERKRNGVPEGELFSLPFHLGVGLTLWCSCILCAGAGAALGGSLGDLSRWGFMMAFPATFIGLVAGMRPAWEKSAPVITSALATALASLVLPLHWSILLGTLLGLVVAALRRPGEKKPSEISG